MIDYDIHEKVHIEMCKCVYVNLCLEAGGTHHAVRDQRVRSEADHSGDPVMEHILSDHRDQALH
jgi:hypothetical protein